MNLSRAIKKISTPLDDSVVMGLRSGDNVLLSGVVFTARDAAHARLVELIDSGKKLPFDIGGQIIYYVGPTPTRPGKPIGASGPTTAGRMDKFSPKLLDAGLKGMIGKGQRTRQVIDSIVKNKAVYFAATGGAAALLAKSVKSCEVVAYEDLGCEAIHRLEIVEMPLIVINDCYGHDLYEENLERYAFPAGSEIN